MLHGGTEWQCTIAYHDSETHIEKGQIVIITAILAGVSRYYSVETTAGLVPYDMFNVCFRMEP